MATSLIDLRPDRRLLDPEFEGYKLKLQKLPHFVLDLPEHVDRVFPDVTQYSLIHAKLFALHNHLVPDPWEYSHSYYYIDKKQMVRHLAFDIMAQKFHNRIVYNVPAIVPRKPGHFNLSLSFPASNVALVSDGAGYLHIVDTLARNRAAGWHQTWQTVHTSLVLGDEKYFVIVDSRLQETNDDVILHCLIQSIELKESYCSVLSWITFKYVQGTWRHTSFRQLQGKGIIHYAAIETSCLAVYVASDHRFKFTADSEKQIGKKCAEPKKILYTWLQTTEDVTITLNMQEDFDKRSMRVSVAPSKIEISYAGREFINGVPFEKVDSELTIWNVESGQVKILITKSESKMWEELIQGGDKNGEQQIDEGLLEEAHKRLAHLCSETEATAVEQSVAGIASAQLEECDAASEEDTVLVRMDKNHDTTHKLPLSMHQYLFSVRLEGREAPALVLRHDVDACIWQTYTKPSITDSCPLLHLGTLLAFGYVQSSKRNKKFLTCSPNFSYSVVCEACKHIFIYRSRPNQDCQLRNRNAGAIRDVRIGQQNLFNVEKYGEVLGIDATNDYLFVLTGTSIIGIMVQ